jgi:hypothetical protein
MCRRLRILPERGEQGYEIWPIKVREKRDESTGDLVASCFKSMTYRNEWVFSQERPLTPALGQAPELPLIPALGQAP